MGNRVKGQMLHIPGDEEIHSWVRRYPTKKSVLHDAMLWTKEKNSRTRENDRMQKERFPDFRSDELTHLARNLGQVEMDLFHAIRAYYPKSYGGRVDTCDLAYAQAFEFWKEYEGIRDLQHLAEMDYQDAADWGVPSGDVLAQTLWMLQRHDQEKFTEEYRKLEKFWKKKKKEWSITRFFKHIFRVQG